MAANGLWFEKDLNKEVWKFYKKCTCGGTLTYKYRHATIPKRELWIYPNRKQFKVIQNNQKILFGTTADMVTKLNAL